MSNNLKYCSHCAGLTCPTIFITFLDQKRSHFWFEKHSNLAELDIDIDWVLEVKNIHFFFCQILHTFNFFKANNITCLKTLTCLRPKG